MLCNLANGVPKFRRNLLPKSSGWIEAIGSSIFYILLYKSALRQVLENCNHSQQKGNLKPDCIQPVNGSRNSRFYEARRLFATFIHHETVSRDTQI